MKAKLMGLLKDQEGQGLVEYGLIIAAVALLGAVFFVVLGPRIQNLFDSALP